MRRGRERSREREREREVEGEYVNMTLKETKQADFPWPGWSI